MKRRKKPLTLLEIMIVIFLIGLIGSVIGYNMKGSLDEGKAFKSEQGMAQIRDILLLEVAKGKPREDVINNAEKYLKRSGIVKDVSKMIKDGWGEKFKIQPSGNSDIKVVSEKYTKFKQAKNKKAGGGIEEVEEEENEDWEES
jgi:type II secretory pathway pseudopilin PulG